MDDSAQIARLKARIAREKAARQESEGLLEQKSMELFEANQELKVMAEHLENIVEQRTEALQNATEEALRLATAKSQFLANISHEFKTPLNGILGSLSLLKATELDEQQAYMLDTAESSGENLVRLINDVLDVNNLSSNQMTLYNVPFSPAKVINQALDNIRDDITKKQLTLEVDIREELPAWLKGDPGRIRQIFDHLLSNAIKFSEQGTISVTLSYNDTGLKLLVADQGIGIAESQKEHIFDIFTKEDESFSRSYGGIGLGLTLCQKLTVLMGGTISLNSVLHQGTEVKVLLPLAIETEDIPQDDSFELEEATPDVPESLMFCQQQVLLVEDNLINQQVAKDLLESKNLEVTIADNGLEALNILDSREFDLILMDIQMPVMDGLEATRHIRASTNKYASLPILVLTAHGLPQDIKKSMDAGANEHITKPFNTQKLIAQMAQYLKWKEGIIEQSSTTPEEKQSELYGIDLPSALERLMNNPQLLEKVMVMFYNQYLDFETKLLRSINDTNHEETQRALHTLKGSAGNVSAYNLSSLAAELESDLKHTQLCKQWRVKHKPHLSKTFEEVNNVLAGIKAKYIDSPVSEKPSIEAPASPKNDSTPDKHELIQSVEKIKENIYVDLTEVEQQISQLKVLCKNDELQRLVLDLENGYQAFDYDVIEQRCEDLLNKVAS